MAVHKAIRTSPPAQPQPQQAKTGFTAIPDCAKAAQSGNPGAGDPKPQPQPEGPRPNQHQTKAEIFDVLRHLNRGYGIALAALDKLETKARQSKDRARIFPTGFLHGYRTRAEILRAETNRDLLRLMAAHEDQDALHFQQVGQ